MTSNFCSADKSDSSNISQSLLDVPTKGTREEWQGLSTCIDVVAFS